MVTALRALGLEPGDKVALLSELCPVVHCRSGRCRWGYVSVPHLPHRQRRHHRIRAAPQRNQAIFVGKLGRLEEPGGGVPGDRIAAPALRHHAGRPPVGRSLAQYDPIPGQPWQAPDALLSLVYTSGSTGKPKGGPC